MSIKEVTAENLASLFFHYQAALAPDFGCDSADSSDWTEMPANERQRMIAAARLTLLDLAENKGPGSRNAVHSSGRRPEEGREWGC